MIVAAGLGTRVSNITYNIIPKYLINIDTFNGLYHIINYWSKYVDNISLVIHPFFKDITEYYIDNFHKDKNIKIILYEESDGTAYTIHKVLKDNKELFKEEDELIITWCDIFPDKKIDIIFGKIESDICIFVNGEECRYKYNKELKKIENVGKTGGDIIGIYYIRRISQILKVDIEKNKDIVDYLEEIGSIETYELEKICDYGDELKLYKLREEFKKTSINHRHFNELIIKNGNVFKRGVNEQGKHIIENEINWFKYIKNLKVNNDFDLPIPEVRSLQKEYYIMEYLENYITVAEYLNNIEDGKEKIIENIINNVNFIHSIKEKKVDKIEFKWNLMYESIGKIKERLKDVEKIIESVGKIEYVNGRRIGSIDNLFEKIKKIIEEYYEFNNENKEYKYNIIHGDLNFSNIMIENNSKKIKFIDPRGYFGKSKVYGCKEYDYAKILYGIYGYDYFQSTFNFQPIGYNKFDKTLNFIIPKININKEFINKHFQKIHYAFLIVIWLGLAQYTKNNYWKCICSYYYALYLEELLD